MNKEDLVTAVRSVLERHPYILRAELFGSQRSGEGALTTLGVFIKNQKPLSLGAFGLYWALLK